MIELSLVECLRRENTENSGSNQIAFRSADKSMGL